jgi:hypothetical protein
MNTPHLAKSSYHARRRMPPGSTSDTPAGWSRYASQSRGLTFRYPSCWNIARQANYLFISTTSAGPDCEPANELHRELVLDLTPVHLYPYSDLKEFLDRTQERTDTLTETEITPLSDGYMASCQSRRGAPGKEFFLYYIGKGNMAYTLTAIGKELRSTVDQIIESIRFQ